MRPWGKKNINGLIISPAPKKRIQETEKLASRWAKVADRIVEKHGKRIALICMEEVDEPIARSIKNKMKGPEMVKIFSSREFNASQMTNILRSFDLPVTSRYHGGVLSLEAKVPQITIGHDTRLRDFYIELGIEDYLLDYMVSKPWHKLSA